MFSKATYLHLIGHIHDARRLFLLQVVDKSSLQLAALVNDVPWVLAAWHCHEHAELVLLLLEGNKREMYLMLLLFKCDKVETVYKL